MVRDSALGALLSFAIIAVVAVAFYRPEPAADLARPSPAPVTTAEPAAIIPAAVTEPPTPPPSVPNVETPLPRSTRVSRSYRVPRPTKVEARSQAPAPPKRRSPKPHQPASAFASVEAGETLADVAWRVYGDESAAATLRSANRDQLSGPDATLHAGMLLRTP